MATTKESCQLFFYTFLFFFRSMEKIVWDSRKWGQEVLSPANPDLAVILGAMDLISENFYF